MWASTPLDVSIDQVNPFQEWVIVKELTDITKYEQVAGQTLQIVRLKDRHTVYGELMAIHPSVSERLQVGLGDTVIYREWSGGRWDIQGEEVLIMKADDVIARVDL